MANPNAKTLQIFLPTGEPRGIRIAELTTRIVQAVLIPRSDLATAKAWPTKQKRLFSFQLWSVPSEPAFLL